jgi:hypothetical protein
VLAFLSYAIAIRRDGWLLLVSRCFLRSRRGLRRLCFCTPPRRRRLHHPRHCSGHCSRIRPSGLLLIAKVGRGSFAHSQTRAGPTAIPEVMVPACSVFRASFPSLQGQNILDSFVNDVCLAALASDVNTVNESTLVIYVDLTVVSVGIIDVPSVKIYRS